MKVNINNQTSNRKYSYDEIFENPGVIFIADDEAGQLVLCANNKNMFVVLGASDLGIYDRYNNDKDNRHYWANRKFVKFVGSLTLSNID